jgi:ethanolamine utilization protein EutJ
MIADAANQLLLDFEAALALNRGAPPTGPLFAGVDLGTAYTVTAVVDANGAPVAGALTRSRSSIRDGLVLDYLAAVGILRQQVRMLQEAGFNIRMSAAAYPPGTRGGNARVFANVLEAAGLEVAGLIEEPTAASLVLNIADGAVVDIGGGTTGITVLRGGAVIYTADEATGGIHADLVIAGHFRIDTLEAEQIKTDPARQAEIFPVIRPVFQKMASIARHHLQQHPVETLYLVGGTSAFPGIREVLATETGLAVEIPVRPLLVTPLGIALSCWQTETGKTAGSTILV